MRVVIAGGHGKIALLLEERLSSRGDQAVGIVRNPDHVPDLEERGAEAVVLDLEQATLDEVTAAVEGADAVVFAAGGGPGSGVARKETVDKGAAILLADAAERAGVRRYLMVSSMGTDRVDPTSEDVFQVYLRAKKAADDDLRSRDLDWTIIQPGRLTDGPGTAKVSLDPTSEPRDIPRADVAHALAAALDSPATVRKQFTLLTGVVPIEEALTDLP
jgi:uncharacterized protein YbjT (DUF2867 family)